MHRPDIDEIDSLLMPSANSARSIEEKRHIGSALFNRATQERRLHLLDIAVSIAKIGEPTFSLEAAGAFFRSAYDSEPYIGGIRRGNFFTALIKTRREHFSASDINRIILSFEYWMMSSEERRELELLAFPLDVYRGGTECDADLLLGTSWTLKFEIAAFFANEWPKRWGDDRAGTIVKRVVDRDAVAALFTEREEYEVLVPIPPSAA